MKGQTIKRKDSNVPGLLLEFEGYDRGWPSCCASLTAGAGTRCMSLLSSSPNLLTKSKDSCSYLLSFCYGSRLKESSVNRFVNSCPSIMSLVFLVLGLTFIHLVPVCYIPRVETKERESRVNHH